MPNPRLATALALSVLALMACQPADVGQEEAAASDAVVITARDFEYEMPREIRSGWSTLRFVNESDEQEHFILFGKLPDDRTFAEYRAEVFDVYMDVLHRYDAGELTREEAAGALGDELPAWYFEEVELTGGTGLTEPGRTSRVTLRLEPGTYAVECYVRTPQGTFHNDRGMLRKLVVTEDSSTVSPPEPDAELTLSNYQFETSGQLTAGTQPWPST